MDLDLRLITRWRPRIIRVTLTIVIGLKSTLNRSLYRLCETRMVLKRCLLDRRSPLIWMVRLSLNRRSCRRAVLLRVVSALRISRVVLILLRRRLSPFISARVMVKQLLRRFRKSLIICSRTGAGAQSRTWKTRVRWKCSPLTTLR